MRNYLLLTLCLFPLCLTAQYKVTVNFDNTSTFIGKKLAIRVYDRTTSTESVKYTEPAIEGIAYARDLLGLVQGHDYNIDAYIDRNGSGDYEAYPADVAWRKTVDGVTADVTADFVVEDPSVDIMFPRRSADQLHYVSKTYVGSWKNLTYSTTGQATGTSALNYEAGTANLSMTTNGAFGIPAPITMDFSGTVNTVLDSADLAPQSPATGYLRLVRGRAYGVVTLTSPPVSLEINGNYGEHQIMFTYVMTGAFSANGIMTMTQATATDVEPSETPRALAQPNPAQSSVLLRSDASFSQITVHNNAGRIVCNVDVEPRTEHNLDIRDLPAGVYHIALQDRVSTRWVALVVH